MSQEKDGEEGGPIKVKDHRRFNPDGSEKTTDEPQKVESEELKSPPSLRQASEEGAEVSLANLILSFAGSAQISLGVSPNPLTQKVEKDLRQAKQMIDLLGLLSEKTKGNLSLEEAQLLEVILTDLRLRFVEEKKKS